jgi:hypothetical protein
MATTTRANLRKALSEYTGDYVSFSCSSDGNTAKTSIVADGLRNRSGGTDVGAFEDYYFLATSGSNSGESKHGQSYIPDATDGATVLVQDSFTDTTASGDSFEMHRIDPDLKHAAIHQAINELFPTLYLPIRSESLVVDSILLNGDFEDWTSGSADNWTEVNSPTITQETSTIFHGSNSLKMVGPSGSVGQVYQDLSLASITEVEGLTLHFKMRVWTNASSQARLIIDDGVTTTNGDYHGGNSEWAFLSVTAAIGSSATRARVICEVTEEDTAYFDSGWAAVNPVHKYTIPSSIIRGPMHVLQQYNENMIDGPYYPLMPGEIPTRGRILRLEGMGVLTSPTSETATTEIGEPRLRLLATYAALKLVEVLGERSASEQISNLDRRRNNWERTVARLSREPGIRMRTIGASRGKNAWHIEEDASGRYLIFNIARNGLAGFSS